MYIPCRDNGKSKESRRAGIINGKRPRESKRAKLKAIPQVAYLGVVAGEVVLGCKRN
jgi:hypothetical protein